MVLINMDERYQRKLALFFQYSGEIYSDAVRFLIFCGRVCDEGHFCMRNECVMFLFTNVNLLVSGSSDIFNNFMVRSERSLIRVRRTRRNRSLSRIIIDQFFFIVCSVFFPR